MMAGDRRVLVAVALAVLVVVVPMVPGRRD